MKKGSFLLLINLLALSLCGCGGQVENGNGESGAQQSGTQNESETRQTEPSDVSQSEASETDGRADAASETTDTGDAGVPEVSGTERQLLSEQELTAWTTFVNNAENNGFLNSFYDSPEAIDLNMLFYDGLGLDQEELTPEETAEYLALTGADEIYTDITRITGAQLELILQDRLGLTYADMAHPLDWYYLESSDSYLLQHGDTNAQNFVCVSGVREGDMITLDCLSEMTDETCRVTLRQLESGALLFVSNENVSNAPVSEEVYNEVLSRIGQDAALQLRTFAENAAQWLPEEWELSPETLELAVYDLDGDGRLELMRTQVQGTGRFADNCFYQADPTNALVYGLEQEALEDGLAFEIAQCSGAEETVCVYADAQGRLLYPASDYAKAGLSFVSRTDGYFYLENKTLVSVPVRSYVTEYDENLNDSTEYWLPDQDAPVTADVWEDSYEAFRADKTAKQINISWKSLDPETLAAKTAQDWFLLLAESLEEGE